MANTLIRIPFLRPDLPQTVDVISAADLSVVESVSLTVVNGVHEGTVTGSHSGTFIFNVKHNGNAVEDQPRVRTIADDAGPWVIVTGLDNVAGGASLLFNPADDDLVSVGWKIVYDQHMQRENDVPITVQMVSGPGDAGFSLDDTAITVLSKTVQDGEGENIVGYVEFPRLRRGATYAVWRGSAVGAEPLSPFAQRSIGTRGTFIVPNQPKFAIIETIGHEVEVSE
jgi:hypothetical protein